MTKNHVINDPIHQVMTIGQDHEMWLTPIIDHPIFQRLRYIKQLGLAELVFPSATHNRFCHSIGTSFLSMRIAAQIGLTKKHTHLLSIACLLHDIGHGPFSHVFEGIFANVLKCPITHEEWTPLFIDEFKNKQFLNHYNKINPKYPLSISKLTNIITLMGNSKPHTGINRLFCDILSSQLDADRLDYLLRDSHFCGVTYGKYDLEWLINCLMIYKDINGNYNLTITPKGIGTAEQYLISRIQMNKKVYYHKTVVAAEFLLTQFIQNMIISLQNEDTLLLKHPNNLLLKFLNCIKNLTKTNKTKIMAESYKYYSKINDYDIYYLIRQYMDVAPKTDLSHLAYKIHSRQIPFSFKIRETDLPKCTPLINDIKNKMKLSDWQLYVYKPKLAFYDKNKSPILVYDDNTKDKVYPLSDASNIVKTLANLQENLAYLFIDREIATNKKLNPLLKYLKKTKCYY